MKFVSFRCFKKDAGIDQIVIATAEAERNDPKGMDKSQDIENNKTNSSNVSKSASVIFFQLISFLLFFHRQGILVV